MRRSFLRRSRDSFHPAHLRQPQQIERRHRTRRRLRAVVVFLHPQQNALVFAAGAEVAAALFVEEQLVLRLLQLDRELQPADIEGRFVEIEQPWMTKA